MVMAVEEADDCNPGIIGKFAGGDGCGLDHKLIIL